MNIPKNISDIPYKQIENFPCPFVKLPLNQVSDKDKSRVIFKLAFDFERMTMVSRQLGSDLLLQNCPIYDGQ